MPATPRPILCGGFPVRPGSAGGSRPQHGCRARAESWAERASSGGADWPRGPQPVQGTPGGGEGKPWRMRAAGPTPPGTSRLCQCGEVARRIGRCWRRGPLPDTSGRIATLPMDLIGFGYAALVTFGSILGYKRRGGVPSLIAGLFVGFLAGYGAYRVSNDKRDVKLSLFTAFFLATIMGVRYKRSKKIMPAGLVAGLSLMMILRLILLLL
ncbi:transmembrane protein 14A isoform X1 [Mustela nigripes]|uniref:Transmembrane protein 14A n=3 Tax=Mustelidae TaxID=9655 RepID=A0A8U0UTP8_MUSPF|nr:transmembrane protein 14A [Mustela putorius furo]XP_059256230.1 transmembrane protein 14A isoform X1 [Mustela nigripes]XP_059256232.1 transmembrane protein 14A isoform X1 [Mustela nigripes]XP_059256233.1 transmembrane protein 14A isoform X1 [Mustela nigripes]